MKKLLLVASVLALIAAPAWSETSPAHKPLKPQNVRMKACAVQYHEKKIAKSQYRAFMKQCLKKHPAKVLVEPPKVLSN